MGHKDGPSAPESGCKITTDEVDHATNDAAGFGGSG